MLALKLLLVPAFLLLISIAGRRWGPAVAGWLAGLPVLTGPILFLLALENDTAFAAAAATVSLSAVFGAVVFILSYARVCARRSPAISLLCSVASWTCVALLLTRLPLNNSFSLGIALLALVIAPKLFPRISAPILTAALPKWELPLRMLAGAAVTLAVTTLAAAIGPSWSGMFAVFPVITTVLAVFSHRASGPAFTVILLRAMIWGLYSLASFCFALAVLLPRQSVTVAFLAAIAAAIAVQWGLKSRLHRR
jgi:hypothetical protein